MQRNIPPDEPLLRNYIDDASWFGELSGTTLLAATAYRVAALGDAQPGYVAWADEKRRAVTDRIGDDGLLYPVINPLNWGDRTPSGEPPRLRASLSCCSPPTATTARVRPRRARSTFRRYELRVCPGEGEGGGDG